MKKMLLFMALVIILSLPVYSAEAYTIFLKNGAVISDVKTYEESGDSVNLYFDTGSMSVSKKDILKIEGKESPEPEKETVKQQPAETQGMKEQTKDEGSPQKEQAVDREEKRKNLQAEIDSLTEQIRAAEKEEARLVSEINEKNTSFGSRYNYNIIQLKQFDKELEPLNRQLNDVRQKKERLVEKRSAIEASALESQ